MKEPSKSFFSYIPEILDEIINQEARKEFQLITEDFTSGLINAKTATRLIKIQLEKIE